MKKKNLLAISGSVRKNSSNEKILEAIADLYQQEFSFELYTQLDQLPHFNPDAALEMIPEIVLKFRKKIAKADAVLICTPEYVFSPPAVLKNALEWTVATTVFSDKPAAFIVASSSGEKAFEALDLILSTLVQKKLPGENRLLIKGGRASINETGQITDEKALQGIKKLMDALIAEIAKN